MASQLLRRSVPNDNSCLFYAFALLCEDADPSNSIQTTLREVCAQAALTDEDPATRALFLGHPTVQAYADWIRNPHHWGGENEIVMLAKHYGVEVKAVSCESLSTLCYGQNNQPKKRVYILYTGQHYDPLVGVGKEGAATPSDQEVRRFLIDSAGMNAADLETSALDIARRHNAEAARKARQRRVKRIKCDGCGAVLDDAAAFQEHCMEVEHDDDFAYGCQEVEIVIEEGEDLPEGSIDLTDENKHATFYNADDTSPLSSSWTGPAPFDVEGKSYRTMEHYWQSIRYGTTSPELAATIALADSVAAAIRMSNTDGMDKVRADWDDVKADLLLKGLRGKFGPGQDCQVATKALKDTAPKAIVCIDVDPWAGMSAAGGIATGQNHVGRALEIVRSERLENSSP